MSTGLIDERIARIPLNWMLIWAIQNFDGEKKQAP
jgi:hypothetical protein